VRLHISTPATIIFADLETNRDVRVKMGRWDSGVVERF
jgi:hypothetical protein